MKILHNIIGVISILGLLACAGKDGGVGAVGTGGFSGTALDAGSGGNIIGGNNSANGGDGDAPGSENAAPLDAGNVGPTPEWQQYALQLSCAESVGLNTPDFDDYSTNQTAEEAPKLLPYKVKARVEYDMAEGRIVQVVDKDANKFLYVRVGGQPEVDGDAKFVFTIHVDTNPSVEFWLTDIVSVMPLSGAWQACGPDACPKPGWIPMITKYEDSSCDFLKSKPQIRVPVHIPAEKWNGLDGIKINLGGPLND